jgi:hypothetical protein
MCVASSWGGDDTFREAPSAVPRGSNQTLVPERAPQKKAPPLLLLTARHLSARGSSRKRRGDGRDARTGLASAVTRSREKEPRQQPRRSLVRSFVRSFVRSVSALEGTVGDASDMTTPATACSPSFGQTAPVFNQVQ